MAAPRPGAYFRHAHLKSAGSIRAFLEIIKRPDYRRAQASKRNGKRIRPPIGKRFYISMLIKQPGKPA